MKPLDNRQFVDFVLLRGSKFWNSAYFLNWTGFLWLVRSILSKVYVLNWLSKLASLATIDASISGLLLFVIEAYDLRLVVVACTLIVFLIAVVLWAPLLWASKAEKIALKHLSVDRPASVDPKVRIRKLTDDGKWHISGYYAYYIDTETLPEKRKVLSTRNFEIVLSRCGRVETFSYTGR